MPSKMDHASGDSFEGTGAHPKAHGAVAMEVVGSQESDGTKEKSVVDTEEMNASVPTGTATAVDAPAPAPAGEADASTASRKRPPPSEENFEESQPSVQRPRPAAAAATAAASQSDGNGAAVDDPQQILLDFAMQNRPHQQQQQLQPNGSNNLYTLPATSTTTPTTTSFSQNSTSHLHNSLVHLSIVKSKPSFTEPWKKLSPISLVGTGIVLQWKNDNMEKEGEAKGNDGEDTNARRGNNDTIRILTNARTVQYATSIRARTQNSPMSVGCTLEYISLARDLALLKVTGKGSMDWKAIALPIISSSLPRLGGEVACLGFSEMALSCMSAPSPSSLMQQQQQQFLFGRYCMRNSQSSRHVDLVVWRGTVAGYYAKEDEHHLLRMRVSTYAAENGNGRGNNSAGRVGGEGLVVDGSGNIVGMVASSSSQEAGQSTTSTGIGNIIPGPVIAQFLTLCNTQSRNGSVPNSSHAHAHAGTATHHCHTDGECSASRDTGDEETSQSERPAGKGSTSKKSPLSNSFRGGSTVQCLPGIPTLGITGFQTLENLALRRTLGLTAECDDFGDCGVRILGINHTVHPANDSGYQSQCKEDRKCHTSMLRTDDVLLAIDDVPIRLDGTVPLARGRENERVDFRWLISQRPVGTEVKLDVLRGGKRIQLNATLTAPRYLVPRCNDDDDVDHVPSYVICGGCVFVPLTQAWLLEMLERQRGGAQSVGPVSSPMSLQGFQRYMQEQRRGDQQIIILSHVLADDVNVGYHDMGNMILTSVNGQRPINNMSALMDLLVKQDGGLSLEFRCSYVNLDRAKVVICMDAKEIGDSEPRILSNYMIDAWCSNALSPALKKEAEGKAHRHGVTCGLKTMRALRNAVRETTLVVRRPAATDVDSSSAVAATRRIMDFTETHKMQSAPLFAGKWTEEGGWTQVKTKHLSQLCACGKSTRFYCICTVGVMRCKDCFIKHCRDHSDGHECSETCKPDCEGAAKVLAEGVELVTTKKRKRNNPTQAIQSRCVVCKAKTCYCCSACGFEKEVALCHVSTGRNCLPIHTSEHHSTKKCDHTH